MVCFGFDSYKFNVCNIDKLNFLIAEVFGDF